MDIRDIARRAGVSPSTVSRIFNGTKPVSPALRERVEKVVGEIGYVPNHAARSMVTKRTHTVGIVLPEVSFFFHQTIVQYVEERLAADGYRLLVSKAAESSGAALQRLAAKRIVDGLILMVDPVDEEMKEKLFESGIPLIAATVMLNRPAGGARIDDRRAVIDGLRYLHGLGHRRIGLVSGNGKLSDGLRREGFRAAARELGLSERDTPQAVCDYSLSAGYRAAADLLALDPRPTALFVLSDEMAVGAIRAASDMGIAVPEDLSVLGFDGIELGAFIRPGLTTVAQPLREIGVIAAETLLAVLRDGTDPEAKLLPHTILERESCRRI